MDTDLLARFIGWTLLTPSVAWSVLPIAWLGRPGLLFPSSCLFHYIMVLIPLADR
nr:hypothetical protein Q903MT_gene2628 [Picea sitchensis]